MQKSNLILILVILIVSCSSTRMIPVEKVKEGKSVTIYLKDGQKFDGFLFKSAVDNLLVVNKSTHERVEIPKKQIRRIDYLNEYLDYQGNPIAKAEVKKYKGNQNSLTYTIGGFALGGIGGIVLGLPLWLSDTGVKPYFVGGIGAVLGGIYFGFKGSQRDEERAVETIRILREKKDKIKKDNELKEAELKRLKKIEEEKQRIREKLNKKDK